MAGELPSMTTAEAQPRLSELAARVRETGEPLALTEGGETLAVLVPLRDVHALAAVEDQADAALAAERYAEYLRTGQSYTHDEVFKGLLKT